MTDAKQRPLLLVLGGNSDIGLAVAREFASKGHDIILAARKCERLTPFIADFKIRFDVDLQVMEFDMTATATHRQCVDPMEPLPDIVLCAAGVMYDEKAAEADFALAHAMIATNYAGAVSILELFAGEFEKRGSGRIIGLSSIAGLRGRASNYLYGSTKAAFAAYLEGLQHRLKKTGVRVDIIKPGFVKTRMTDGMDLPQTLLVLPEALAKTIVSARADRREIFPNFKWMLIAHIIRHLPNFLFLRTKL